MEFTEKPSHADTLHPRFKDEDQRVVGGDLRSARTSLGRIVPIVPEEAEQKYLTGLKLLQR